MKHVIKILGIWMAAAILLATSGCEFTMDYDLVVTVNGSGNVTPSSGTYSRNTLVTLTATPNSGWVFSGWSGDVSGTNSTINVRMNSDKRVVATFTRAITTQYTLAVSVNGSGSVTPSGGTYDQGSRVTLTATPNSNWLFSSWSGDASGTGTSVTVTMDSDKYITANFMLDDPSDDDDDDDDTGEVTFIGLNGTGISVSGAGASANGSVVTISSAGTYQLDGTLYDGQVIVDTEDVEDVVLVLNGVDISCSTSAPVFVVKAEDVTIYLNEGTVNTLEDSANYVFDDPEEDEPNATLFSKEDLTIDGKGTLNITGNYNDGIASKDSLKIADGVINVTAVDDGLRGKDDLTIKKGTILTVNAGGDALKSTEDEDPEKGYVKIKDGTMVTLVADGDGIDAETDILILGGTLDVKTGGGSNAGIGEDESAKGLKAGSAITVDGGTIAVNSADDTLHSDDTITINGGTLTLSSGDDAFHSEYALVINGGSITINRCYEGLEGVDITINQGDIKLVSSDDGINAAGSGDEWSTSNSLAINGGTIAVYADGDGVDSNGDIVMTDGVVLVHGPTANNNGALDCNGRFNMNGGVLVAAGSSGMAEAPDTSSNQNSVKVTFSSTMGAGSLFHLESSGYDVVTFAPTKRYQSMVVSSPLIRSGDSYTIFTGGSSTGTETNGLYENGTYYPGTEYTTFTASGTVTNVGGGGGGTWPWW